MSAPPVPPAPPARNFRLTVLMLVGLVAGAYLAFGIATAKQTLGCDFQVYRAAADRFLAGLPIYDTSISSTGSCNLFYYPPSFVALVVPFALLGETLGNAAWITFLVVCSVVGWALPSSGSGPGSKWSTCSATSTTRSPPRPTSRSARSPTSTACRLKRRACSGSSASSPYWRLSSSVPSGPRPRPDSLWRSSRRRS